MPLMPDRLCACHGEPVLFDGRAHNCYVKFRARQQKYIASAKGQAQVRKQNESAAGAVRRRKYKASEKGLAARRRRDARRVYINRNKYVHGATVEQAERIKDYVRRRLSEFKQRQSARAETESVSPGSVCPETEA